MGGEFEAALVTYCDRIAERGADRIACSLLDKSLHLTSEELDLARASVGLGVGEGLRDILDLPGVVDREAFVRAVLDSAL